MVEEVTPRCNESTCVFVATLPAAETLATQTYADPCTPVDYDEATHLTRLQEVIEARIAALTPQRRGSAKQQPARKLEQHVRHDAVDFYLWLKGQGGTCSEAATLLDVSARTLRQWDHDRHHQLQVAPLGRPAIRSTVTERQDVLNFIHRQESPPTVTTVREAFPALGRNELADLLARRRQTLRKRYHDTIHVLRWQQPGRVWAIDFAEPSLLGEPWSLPPVDGIYPYVLAVRDLASGYQLAWTPQTDMGCSAVKTTLNQLFTEHGAPLVLKMDNGPAFRAADLQAYLAEMGVICLYSPPHCPSYNGAIEAAIGALKSRTEQQAALAGRPGLWTTADLQTALTAANSSHPRHLKGLTPADAWAKRTEITAIEQACLVLAVDSERLAVRSEQDVSLEAELDHWQGSAIDRVAIRRALVSRGYLVFRRRRIPLTV